MTETTDYKYDVFISYSRADLAWVEGELLPRLEAAGISYNYQLQFELGRPQLEEIERAVIQSRKTLLALSPAYLASDWQQFDSILSGSYDLDKGQWRTVPAIVQPCKLPTRLRALVSIDFCTPDEDSWQRLVKALQQPAHLFICYKRNADPDQRLAHYLHELFTAQGHDVFIDGNLRTGEAWLREIDKQIKASDFLIVLLSKESADSEMVQAEVFRAYEYRQMQGRPHTFPVRVAYEGLLPYTIAAFLNPLHYVVWHGEADNAQVAQDILTAIAGRLPATKTPIQVKPVSEEQVISEDGRPVADNESWHSPLPQFDPRFLEKLDAPGGVVKLRDKLYIEREADANLKREIVKWGTTTTIRAPRQTGKTSLLMRGIHYARNEGAKIALIDIQSLGSEQLASADIFLQELAESICHELCLDAGNMENAWRGSGGTQKKITYFLEDYILSEFKEPIILAMDEADSLLETPFYRDFFALVRSWHNRRAYHKQWDNFNIVMVISTEPLLLIDDINQSPFNVGLRIELEDFDETQVRNLNSRHGAPVNEDDFPGLMKLLNGHPYLTRKALYTLVTERIIWADLARVAPTDQGPFGDHLRRYHWLLRDAPDLQETLKQVIRHNRYTDDAPLYRLVRAGLVKGRGDSYRFRCDLYRQYFEDKLL